jgi:hypothetical protein
MVQTSRLTIDEIPKDVLRRLLGEVLVQAMEGFSRRASGSTG